MIILYMTSLDYYFSMGAFTLLLREGLLFVKLFVRREKKYG